MDREERMSGQIHLELGAYCLGHADGRELAAALLLASSRAKADPALKRRMAQIVVEQIETKVHTIASIDLPPEFARSYERGARDGVHDGLAKGGVGVHPRRTDVAGATCETARQSRLLSQSAGRHLHTIHPGNGSSPADGRLLRHLAARTAAFVSLTAASAVILALPYLS
jgi:hypothetical protein